jgi:hypothetical protein
MTYTPPSSRRDSVTELTWPCIGVNEIEPARLRPLEEVGAVHDVKAHTPIGAEMPARDRYDDWVCIDSSQSRVRVHARKKPRGAMPGSRPKLQQPPSRLRGREGGKQRADFRFRRHVEAHGVGVGDDPGKRAGSLTNLGIIHGINTHPRRCSSPRCGITWHRYAAQHTRWMAIIGPGSISGLPSSTANTPRP